MSYSVEEGVIILKVACMVYVERDTLLGQCDYITFNNLSDRHSTISIRNKAAAQIKKTEVETLMTYGLRETEAKKLKKLVEKSI